MRSFEGLESRGSGLCCALRLVKQISVGNAAMWWASMMGVKRAVSSALAA